MKRLAVLALLFVATVGCSSEGSFSTAGEERDTALDAIADGSGEVDAAEDTDPAPDTSVPDTAADAGEEDAADGSGDVGPCPGPSTPEVCDGIDNDCDGEIDDGACDDGDPCTVDTCDATLGRCGSTPHTGRLRRRQRLHTERQLRHGRVRRHDGQLRRRQPVHGRRLQRDDRLRARSAGRRVVRDGQSMYAGSLRGGDLRRGRGDRLPGDERLPGRYLRSADRMHDGRLWTACPARTTTRARSATCAPLGCVRAAFRRAPGGRATTVRSARGAPPAIGASIAGSAHSACATASTDDSAE